MNKMRMKRTTTIHLVLLISIETELEDMTEKVKVDRLLQSTALEEMRLDFVLAGMA